jgi:hypothetical protein
MIFKLTVNKDGYLVPKFKEVEKLVVDAMSYWNNFGDHQPLHLKIEKVDDGSKTVHIKVEDGILAADALR